MSLEFREKGQARNINLEVINMEVEFKAMGLEEGRWSTRGGVSPEASQHLEIREKRNKKTVKEWAAGDVEEPRDSGSWKSAERVSSKKKWTNGPTAAESLSKRETVKAQFKFGYRKVGHW